MLLVVMCRTVEINNTDAEGRLVLGDGVSGYLWHCRSVSSIYVCVM